ncbi:hypothetical protein HDU98_001990 [Podochytrium sp. JEL0797]|nr:hypothetical protein HDU98_001990 [Podochytrium sp. JEL0797]
MSRAHPNFQQKTLINPFSIGTFCIVGFVGLIYGPAGQALIAKFSEGNGDSRIITDQQLSLIVNFIGAATFLLIILHHYLEVGRKKVHSKFE